MKEEEGQGRYLVAGRDLEDGEVILEEYPLVAGPLYTRSRPLCLGCLKGTISSRPINDPTIIMIQNCGVEKLRI